MNRHNTLWVKENYRKIPLESTKERVLTTKHIPLKESEKECRAYEMDGFCLPNSIHPSLHPFKGVECCMQPVDKEGHILLVGATELSKLVSQLLLLIGRKVTVVDESVEHLKEDRFPSPIQRIHMTYGALNEKLALRHYEGMMIFVENSKTVLDCISPLLHVLPRYIGVNLPLSKGEDIKKKLRKQGWHESDLDHLYIPMGLDVGATTHEEMAIAIVGEYIRVIHKKDSLPLGGSKDMNKV